MRFLLTILYFLLTLVSANSQENNSSDQRFYFSAHENQTFGYDAFTHKEWAKKYLIRPIEGGEKIRVDTKAVGSLETDLVNFIFNDLDTPQKLSFEYGDNKRIPYQISSDTNATLYLPRVKSGYLITAKWNNEVIGYLNVKVYKPIIQKIQIVNLTNNPIDLSSIQNFLDSVYLAFNVKLDLLPSFNHQDSIIEDILWDNPSFANDRYTSQMRDFRDRFFEPKEIQKDKYYLFIIDGFVNKSRNGYMARNKAMGFIKWSEPNKIKKHIARQLGFGIGMLKNSWDEEGPLRGSTNNLMDASGGTSLTMDQWDDLHHLSNSFSFYDGDEDVITNNGMVAYYFWEEDTKGNIILTDKNILSNLKRPFKKNYKSYHLNIQDQLFEIVFQWGTILICWWHIILWLFLLIIFLTVRYIVKKRWKKNLTSYAKRQMIKWAVGSATILLSYFNYYFVQELLDSYQVVSGYIGEFDELGYYSVNKSVLQNEFLRDEQEESLSSEILIKKDKKWYLKKRKKVLYFDAIQDTSGNLISLKFISDNDNLILKKHQYLRPASSHYFVVNYIENDSVIDQRVYNHVGIDLTSKLNIDDAAKRILLFVNGYRPASTGHSFEENFSDIQKNGFEFPNSSNLIYNFDRFNYWRPWNSIDTKFIKRINPTEIYYADGHFSVETSNHGSIYAFSSLSTEYPHRCRDKNNHICYSRNVKSLGIYGDKTIQTKKLLPQQSNKEGFNVRYQNGRKAGQNFLVMLNEIPNHSKNDTLYLVAHSMGYAYALGMINELKKKIEFGGFYIIAPENASAGKTNLKDWKQVWQYGSDFISDAPCLQDGVAPQTCAAGLSEDQRVYIPENLYYRKGFFDSHFVGYYDWVFKIPKGKKGYIDQH